MVDSRLLWRHISVAPRDGTRLLLAKIVDGRLWWATTGHWSAEWRNWNDGVEPSGLADPNFFLPIDENGVGE